METQNQLTVKSQVNNSTRHLLNSITRGNDLQIVANVREYMEFGVVKFDKILTLPLASRIPNLTHVYGFEKIHAILVTLLTTFSNSLNLIRPMSADQITSCAYELVMTSEEDQLSIEDYTIFFKGALEGKYGRILDRLDQQTIFSMLIEYRSQRHLALISHRENKHLELTALGNANRTSKPASALDEHLAEFNTKLQTMKDELHLKNRELKDLKKQKDF